MSSRKFSRMTASMLVRKGEAAPSAIAPVEQYAYFRPPEPVALRRPRDQSDDDISNDIMVRLPVSEPAPLAFIAVKEGISRPQLLRLAREGGGGMIVVPVTIACNLNGTVALTLSGETETFRYEAATTRWVGDGGSIIAAGPDLFDEPSGCSVIMTVDSNRPSALDICLNGQRRPIKLEGFAAPAPA